MSIDLRGVLHNDEEDPGCVVFSDDNVSENDPLDLGNGFALPLNALAWDHVNEMAIAVACLVQVLCGGILWLF